MARPEKIGHISASDKRKAHRFIIRETTQFSSRASAVEALARTMSWGHSAAAAALDQLGVMVSEGRNGLFSLHIIRGRGSQQVAA